MSDAVKELVAVNHEDTAMYDRVMSHAYSVMKDIERLSDALQVARARRQNV